jgi:hypothetical protein
VPDAADTTPAPLAQVGGSCYHETKGGGVRMHIAEINGGTVV